MAADGGTVGSADFTAGLEALSLLVQQENSLPELPDYFAGVQMTAGPGRPITPADRRQAVEFLAWVRPEAAARGLSCRASTCQRRRPPDVPRFARR